MQCSHKGALCPRQAPGFRPRATGYFVYSDKVTKAPFKGFASP